MLFLIHLRSFLKKHLTLYYGTGLILGVKIHLNLKETSYVIQKRRSL